MSARPNPRLKPRLKPSPNSGPARRGLLMACASGLLAAAWPLAGMAASVRGSGHSATETRALADFQAIALSGSMDLEVRQGVAQSVQVRADDNLLALLETTVESGGNGPTLHVRWKKGENVHSGSRVRVSVTLPRLVALATSGSGDMKVESFTTPSLQLSISGAGDAKLNQLNTDELSIRIAGSGDVSGSGKATKLKIGISGSGDVQLADLAADEVSVKIAGSGDAAVNAGKTLDVSIAGSGDVSYTGNAAVKLSTTGSGSVTKR